MVHIVYLGTPVVCCFPFYFRVSLLQLNMRKKGTCIEKALLGNPDRLGLSSSSTGSSLGPKSILYSCLWTQNLLNPKPKTL